MAVALRGMTSIAWAYSPAFGQASSVGFRGARCDLDHPGPRAADHGVSRCRGPAAARLGKPRRARDATSALKRGLSAGVNYSARLTQGAEARQYVFSGQQVTRDPSDAQRSN